MAPDAPRGPDDPDRPSDDGGASFRVLPPVSAGTAFRRGLACRCPACGRGAVFASAFRHAPACGVCGWRFERGPGHWVGGNEVNVLVTYPLSVLLCVVPAIVLGPSWWTATAGGLLAAGIGIAIHRPARAVFFALDYVIDPPEADGGSDRDGRGGGRDDAGPGPAPVPGGDARPLPDRSPQRPTSAVPPVLLPPDAPPSPRPEPEPRRFPAPV